MYLLAPFIVKKNPWLRSRFVRIGHFWAKNCQFAQKKVEGNLSEECMVTNLKKINAKLQLLYRQIEFLNPKLRKLLCSCLRY